MGPRAGRWLVLVVLRAVARRRTLLLTIAVAAVAALVVIGSAGERRAVGAAPSAGSAGMLGPERTAGGVELGAEVPVLRTRTSRTFADGDGGLVARVFAESVNYRDGQGRWAAIDNALRRSGRVFTNAANRFRVELPASLQSGPVRLVDGSSWAELSLRGARGSAVVAGDTARYADALPGVDVVYRVDNDQLKESVVLHDARAADSLVFDLQAASGLTPRLRAGGTVDLVDAADSVRLSLSAPVMRDASGEQARGVDVVLEPARRGWTVRWRPDPEWLGSAGRQWPVTVDPSVYPIPIRDCFVEDEPVDVESSFCGEDLLELGYGNGHNHHVLLRFDVENVVPADSELLAADLGLYLDSASTTNAKPITAHRMTSGWTPGASWNRHDGISRWDTPGGDHARGAAAGPVWLGGSGSTGQYHYWNLRSLTKTWITGRDGDRRVGNYGVLLRDDPDRSPVIDNRLIVRSTEHASGANRPYLDVHYTRRVGDRRGWALQPFQLSDRISLAVNPAGGNLLVRQGDLTVQGGLGPDLQVARSYNSQGAVTLESGAPDYGDRWDADFGQDVRLVEHWASNARFFYGPSGYVVRFDRIYDANGNATNDYKTPPGFDASLKRNGDGTQTLTEHQSQTKWQFSSTGRLERVEDRNGRSISYLYFATGATRVQKITDSQGRVTEFFTNANGDVTKMVDSAGREYLYGYTGTQLTSYTDPANSTTYYEYGADGMTKVTTPGGRVTRIGYYASGDRNAGRVRDITRETPSTTDVDPKWSFAYDQNQDGTGPTIVSDPRGHETRYEFDPDGRPEKVFDALGRRTTTSYTANANVQTYTAPTNTGSTPNSTLSYDTDGNLEGTSTVAGSGTMSTKTTHGASQPGGGTVQGGKYLPTLIQNQQDTASGSTTQGTGLEYANPEGNPTLIKSTGSVTAQVSMEYDNGADGKPGRLKSTTDAAGYKTSYGYDTTGNLTSITPQAFTPHTGSAALGATTLNYGGAAGADQALSRITHVVDGKGQKAEYSYDGLDRIKTLTYKTTAGATEVLYEYTYDGDGNLTQRKSTEGSTVKTYDFAYDALGRLTSETRPGGVVTTYGYDLTGNLSSLTDANGSVEYGYDAINRTGAIYDPLTSSPIDIDHVDDTKDDGDPNTVDGGSKTTWRYPNGVKTVNIADQAGRLTRTETTNSSGTVLQRFAYDYQRTVGGQGKQIALRETETDKDGNATTYAYDPVLDRLRQAQTKNSGGTVTKTYAYDYDPAGNMTYRDQDASRTWYRYNAASQLCWSSTTSLSQPLPACSSPPSGATTYSYDANGNELTRSGVRTETYNAGNQLKTFTPFGGSVLTMDYAGPGQTERIQDGPTSYVNDRLGIASATGTNAASYIRDENGRVIAQRDPAASSPNRRGYLHTDALGSTRTMTNEAGTVSYRMDYDPYGRDVANGSWSASTRFRFDLGPRDAQDLYRFGERYYDPQLGRWTQQDPLQQPADLREANRYSYVGGNPVNRTDPTGLKSLWDKLIDNVSHADKDDFIFSDRARSLQTYGRLAKSAIKGSAAYTASKWVYNCSRHLSGGDLEGQYTHCDPLDAEPTY